MTNWALIPVKQFSHAKTRLSGLLSEGQRADLAKAMLLDCLRVVTASKHIERIALVSSEPQISELASTLGAQVIPDIGLGLNAALEHGRSFVRSLGASRILVLPADIPCIRKQDIEAVFEQGLSTRDAVIVPAHDGDGTNALLIPADEALPFSYGVGSFSRHREGADTLGIELLCLSLPAIAADLDTPGDLDRITAIGPGPETSMFLRAFSAPDVLSLKEVS
ncbi:2-phospho-L-lactate guanylyltransferase [Roseibium sp.]|uniref:2-phospho-L-lactate guanylyltransferase n=1 Tax=Roseibium sp. TaxID=1936156 RepID=UPI003A986A9E